MKKCKISEIQKQFWILHQLYPDSTAYNIPYLAIIDGELDLSALTNAVKTIVERHDMLRTYFSKDENGEVYQCVIDSGLINFKIEEKRIPSEFNSNLFSRETWNELHGPFDLSEWPLFRIKLFIYDNARVLTIVFHHIIIDLVSANIFFDELSDLYNHNCFNSDLNLKAPVNNYFDYTIWINDLISSGEVEGKLKEWGKYISQKPQKLEFPVTIKNSGTNKTKGRRIYLSMDKNLSSAVPEFARKNIVSDFIVMLSAYALFLNRMSNQSEIIIGVPFRNRQKGKYDRTFGCFVNILPLMVSFSGSMTGKMLLKQVLTSMIKIERKEEIPYLLLNSLLGRGDGSGLFQTGFTFDPSVKLSLNGADAKLCLLEREGSQLDLFFTLWEKEGIYNAFLEYSSDMFEEETVKGFWRVYCKIVKSLINNPDQPVENLEIVPDEDINFISLFNKTETGYEENLCIHEKFEQQVEKTPDAPALLYNGLTLSYKEFNQHANRMANRLLQEGINVEDVVCLCIDRSVEMMVGIYGILKAGGVYLPLNPDTPPERMAAIINDAKPKLVLSTRTFSANIPMSQRVFFIDDILKIQPSDDNSKPTVKVNSKNLAYIIYTSGSTGMPKGVMIEHHSVLNRLGWMQKNYPINHCDTLIQKTPITFDVSVWELFWWSFNGAKLVLLPAGGEKLPETIIQYINSYNVTTIHFVPSLFIAFLGMVKSRDLFTGLKSLKRIFTSGEALPLKVVKEFNDAREKFELPAVINLYGPTEATVDVSFFNCPSNDISQVYIGKPIDNTKLFVVNEKRNLQPLGVPGELIITGVNLARGYLNHPELTNERFVNFKIPGGEIVKAYCTGDLAILTADGEIDYIGRIDNQVKVRGFRIELGDVEAQLHKHPDVTNCAVVVHEEGESKSLIAYICLKPGTNLTSDIIRKYLDSKLPDYMIPSFFVFLNELPLTTSGKLNRKALPKPELINKKDEPSIPVNNCEKVLLRLWRDLLKIENISITDNFFEIGGNSLLAINLTTLISKEFNLLINTVVIFEYPSIKAQSAFISGLKGTETSSEQESDIEKKMQRKKSVEFNKRRI